MRITSFLNRPGATIFAVLFVASSVIADPDGRGRGGRGDGGGGGRGGGESRSVSGSRDSGSRSSRGSERSATRSPSSSQSSRSPSSQSFRSPSSESSRSSSQSYRSPSAQSSRSPSSQSSRSPSAQSFRGPSSQSPRSASDSNRSSSRTFRDGDTDARSARSSSDAGRSSQGAREYQARRPNEDQVRDFLNMRGRDNNSRLDDGRTDRSRVDGNRIDRDRIDSGRTDRDRIDLGRTDRDRNLYSDRWRDTWTGDKRDGRDDRDWSGNWRDKDRFRIADRIRDDWRRRDNYPFYGNWWGAGLRGNYWGFWGNYANRFNRPYYWWSWATGPRLATWVAFGWPRPYYWDYGPGEYIYYDNGGIFVNGRWFQSAPVYYDQTVRIVEQAPDLTAEAAASLEWMPLGVFAATPDGVADPDVLVQLAVTKDGVLGGTAFDQKSGAAFNIRGMVDKRTQRAVWSYSDDRNQRVIMETSIYNLTQPEATGMVHYGPNDMRVVELVRLPEPSDTQGGSRQSATLPDPEVTR